MPTVRSYGLPEQEARAIPAAYPQTPAAGDLATFGGAQARDLQQAGENLGRTADITFSIYERAAKEANELKVDSDMNKFVVEKQKLLVDFSQLKGEDAIKGASTVADSLLNSKKALMAGAANDYQRNVLSRRLDAHLLDATGSVTSHVAKEAQAARVQTGLSTLNNLNNQGVIDQDNAKAIDTQLGIVRDIATNIAKTAHGQSANEQIIKNTVDTAQSEYISGILKSKIGNNSPDTVAFFDKYKDKLTAKDRPALEQAVETLKSSQKAQDFARSPAPGGGGDAKASPDYITRVTGGYEGGTANGGMVPNAQGSGAFGPGQFIQPTWDSVRAAHPELNLPADMTTASRAQHIAALNAFTVDNAAKLQAAGLPVTPATLYLAHRFGDKGAESVLKAGATTPLASILPAGWFAKNPDMGGQTAGSFIQLAEARMRGVTQIPGVTSVPRPSNIADPLAAQVDAATAGRPAPTLEGAVAGATAPAAPGVIDAAQGVPNVRQNLIRLGDWRQKKLEENQAQYGNDPEQFKKNQAAINTSFEQQKQAIELQKNQLWNAVWASIKANPTKMPSDYLTSQLDPREVESLQKMVDRNIEGKKPVTNPEIYSDLRQRLTSTDQSVREEAANLNPMQFRPHLSDQHFDLIQSMQEAVRKGDPEGKVTHAQTFGKKITERLQLMEVNTGDKAKATDKEKELRFTEAAEANLRELEKSKGNKRATPDEMNKILRDLTYEVQGTGGWFDWYKKRGYEVPNPDPSKYVVTIKNIPKTDLDEITAALKAEGMEVNDENIVDRFKFVQFGIRPPVRAKR